MGDSLEQELFRHFWSSHGAFDRLVAEILQELESLPVNANEAQTGKAIDEHVELFDRLRDPELMNNVAAKPEYKSVLVECEKEPQLQVSETSFEQADWPSN